MISLRLRVNRRTSPSRRWAWIRAPSSFHSTDAAPVAASAAATSAAGDGEHRLHRPPRHAAPTAPSASAPPVERQRRRSPPGRPTSCAPAAPQATGTPAAAATASTITPSSAPWRSSPPRTPHSSCCSLSVARPNSRPQQLPGARRPTRRPVVAASRSSARSTSRTSSDGVDAGSTCDVGERRPPDADATLARRAGEERRRPTADLVGRQRAAARRRGAPPSRVRFDVAATRSEASASSANSTSSPYAVPLAPCRPGLVAELVRDRRSAVDTAGPEGYGNDAGSTTMTDTVNRRRRAATIADDPGDTHMVDTSERYDGGRRSCSIASSSGSPATPATACS